MKFITHTEIPTNVQDIIKVSLKRQKPSMLISRLYKFKASRKKSFVNAEKNTYLMCNYLQILEGEININLI